MFSITASFTISASTWDSAVAIFGANAVIKPHRMEIISKTFDRKGRLEKTEELAYRLNYTGEDDRPKQELIKAVEDGVDITEKRLKELEKGSRHGEGGPGGEMEGMDKNPLDPEVQQDVTAVNTGKYEYKNGILCSVWNFEVVLNDKYNGVGKAWLNKETSEAVSMEYHIDPLFPFVDEMNIGMNFIINSKEQWIMNRLEMSGKINMLVMKKSFDSVTTFADYR